MKKIVLLLMVTAVLWGCATFSSSYKLGTQAAMNKDWDAAVEYFEKAVIEKPQETIYKTALLRARIAASYFHLSNARRLATSGNKEDALKEYEIALSYDPLNGAILEENSDAEEVTG